MSKLHIGDKYLITTDQWFYAPNGSQYNAVFGTLKAVNSDLDALGIVTNANSTNWYVEIGDMLIAGCQMHYAIQSNEVNVGIREGWCESEEGVKTYIKPSAIYFADTNI